MRRICISGILLALLASPDAAARTDALALHGAPALPAGFTHLPHVRPDAPKGCTLRMVQPGTFDTLNPFTLRGRMVMGVWNWVNEPLLFGAPDEVQVAYAHLAEAVELDEAAGTVRFTLRTDARWHDGRPVTAEDLAFTAATLARHGRPFHRAALEHAAPAIEGPRTIRYRLPERDPHHAALTLGGLHVLPRHAWEGRDFGGLTMDLPVGSGPYRVVAVEPARRVVFERNPDWWGTDAPTGRGRHNMARIEVHYFRDRIAAFEALVSGQADWMVEGDAKRWAVGYDIPAVREGRLLKVEQPHSHITGMNGFAFNLRRMPFADIRVREALALLLDFEWANAALFHGAFRRTASYFDNSDLAARGAPDAAERAWMQARPDLFPPRALDHGWTPPVSDGTGRDRAMLARALDLLDAAGWSVREADARLVHRETGRPFALAVLAQSNAQQALVGVWFRALRRVGIAPRFEVVDAATFAARTRARDFDVVYRFTIPPEWPGAEQQNLWSSAAASRDGSGNLSGLAHPAIDSLLDGLLSAQDRDSLRQATRLLDRALQWQWLVVPGAYDPVRRLAVSAAFARPDRRPGSGYGDDAWWCRDAEGR